MILFLFSCSCFYGVFFGQFDRHLVWLIVCQNKWWSKRPFYRYVRVQTKLQFFQNHLKLTNLVEDDMKAPFSIANTPRCKGRIKPIHSKKYCGLLETVGISKTNHIRQRPLFLSGLTIHGEHHTTWKQYQNKKTDKKEHFLRSEPPSFWGFFP